MFLRREVCSLVCGCSDVKFRRVRWVSRVRMGCQSGKIVSSVGNVLKSMGTGGCIIIFPFLPLIGYSFAGMRCESFVATFTKVVWVL